MRILRDDVRLVPVGADAAAALRAAGAHRQAGRAPAGRLRPVRVRARRTRCGPATRCTARAIAGRKAYLFCFLDDHSRAVMAARWGYFEDTVRLAAALRPALAARGVPARIYADNGSAFVDAALKRAAARLGIKITHSAPGRPQGRGKIERFFRTVREEFLVEIGDGSGIADLAELNRLFTAWCETVYHARPHARDRAAADGPVAGRGAVPGPGARAAAGGVLVVRGTGSSARTPRSACSAAPTSQRPVPGRPEGRVRLRPVRPVRPGGPLERVSRTALAVPQVIGRHSHPEGEARGAGRPAAGRPGSTTSASSRPSTRKPPAATASATTPSPRRRRRARTRTRRSPGSDRRPPSRPRRSAPSSPGPPGSPLPAPRPAPPRPPPTSPPRPPSWSASPPSAPQAAGPPKTPTAARRGRRPRPRGGRRRRARRRRRHHHHGGLT